MAQGDLLSIPCRWGIIPYRHFGIDIGDGTVVHLATEPSEETSIRRGRRPMRVQRVALETFLAGKRHTIERVSDGLPADEVVDRALGAVGTNYYHLVIGNCEHFARLCKSGNPASHQADRLVRGVMRASLAGLVSTSTRLVTQVAAAGVPQMLLSRSAGMSSLFGEAARHTAYIVSRCSGLEHKHAERIGRSTGIATAAGIGAIAGGVVGCTASAALYLAIDALSQSLFRKYQAQHHQRPETNAIPRIEFKEQAAPSGDAAHEQH